MTLTELHAMMEAALRKEDGAIDVLADVLVEHDILDKRAIDDTVDAPEARRLIRSDALMWAWDTLEQMNAQPSPPPRTPVPPTWGLAVNPPAVTPNLGDPIAIYGPPPIRTFEGAVSEFSLILESRADRISAMRVLRDATSCSLSEAAAKIDQLPLLIAEELTWGDAEELRVQFERAGCGVRIRGDR